VRTDHGCSIGETDCRQLQKIQQEERKEGRWKGGEKGGKADIYNSTNQTQVVVSRLFAQVGRVWAHTYVQVVYR